MVITGEGNFGGKRKPPYRELLELTIFFLGGITPRGLSFKIPGAIHQARWVEKLYTV